jgi:excisionase family DNA binding protein
VTENRKLEARWLTPDEAAEYLRVSRGSLINLVQSGTIPAPKALTTRIIRYDKQAIDLAIAGPSEPARAEPTLGDIDWGTSREERKRQWQERRAKKERSWTQRERREKEERERIRREQRSSGK